MLKLILWGVANPLEFGAIFASAIAIVRGIYAVISRLVAPYPRLRAIVEGFAALGPDVLRFALQVARAITGRALPSSALDSRDAELATLRAEVSRLRAGDEVVIGRPTVTPPAPIEPVELVGRTAARETLPGPAPVDRSGERGSIGIGAAGYLMLLAVASAVLLSACPASRQLTRPALGDVDGCEPRATRCSPTGRPQVCSGSRRWTDADQVCALAVQVAAVCCLTTSPITGAELHACVLPERCIGEVGR